MGIVLLPGKKDKLTYQSADWCENTIRGALFWKVMWNHVTDLAREMLSEHPSKQEIEQFRHRCADRYNPRFPRSSSIDHDARREIDKTVYDLDTVLQQWDLTEAFPLRFYPSKPAHFDAYEIEDPHPSFIR